ncbi:hypothetical protein GTQ40_00855 [Flavobacteriaceae bacterium R38]|nr:hypothetical protein [Flavobacteriaceae bacterium R38]
MKIKFNFFLRSFSIIAILFFTSQITLGQSIEQKEMAKLSFLIGDWKGTGNSIPKNKAGDYTALTKVRYDLDGELLVLKLRSFRGDTPVLSLHTIMYYNKEDGHYHYRAYTKNGARPFKGTLVNNNKLVLKLGENYRLTFQRTPEGAFNEFGEKLVDGKWIKNFEDLHFPTSEITSF